MNSIISEYQNCYSTISGILKNNSDVLAAFVFGSMVSGDLWEKSDIDYFVIVREKEPGITNIYSDFLGRRVHFKLLSKEELLGNRELSLRGGFLHRIFSASKPVFSKDEEITRFYNDGRFYDDISRKKWTLNYLGKLIKKVDSTDKSLVNANYSAAFFSAVEAMHFYGMVEINSRGYMVSRDNINIASSLDSEYENQFSALVSGGDLETRIRNALSYIKESVDGTIAEASGIIFSFLREQNKPVSSNELKTSPYFKDYSIEMEAILSLLYEKKLIKKEYREVFTSPGEILIRENAYLI